MVLAYGANMDDHTDRHDTRESVHGTELIDYPTFEAENNSIPWVKVDRPEPINAPVGTAEENRHRGKVGKTSQR